MSALTLDEIDVLLSETRTRGEIKPILSKFFASGELALNLSETIPGKKAASLRNSVTVNLKTNFQGPNSPAWKIMLVGKSVEDGGEGQAVVLVNMDVYNAQKAAEVSDPSVEQVEQND